MAERAASQGEITFLLNTDNRLDVRYQSGNIQTRPLGTVQSWSVLTALANYKFEIARGFYRVA